MADLWEQVLYPATFGSLPLDLVASRHSFQRSIVRFAPPRRDGAILQDMGADARVVSAQLLFYERAGDPAIPADLLNHIQRCQKFIELANSGKAQQYTDPIFGSFPAMVEGIDVSATADERDAIVVDATFVEQGITTRPLSSELAESLDGAGAAVAVQAELARQAADEAATDGRIELADVDEVYGVTTSCEAEVTSWESDPDITPRDVTAGLQRLSARLAQTTDDLELAADPANYPLFRALQQLHYQVRRAATLARRDAPALILVTLAADVPLRVVLADVYGAENHDRHHDEAIRLNDIDDPSLLSAGTRLTLPTPEPIGRQATRRKGGAR